MSDDYALISKVKSVPSRGSGWVLDFGLPIAKLIIARR
jgi:hypothetical protein